MTETFGHALEPLVIPLGFDWRIVVGPVVSLAARQVIVGTLGTLYGIEGESHSARPHPAGSVWVRGSDQVVPELERRRPRNDTAHQRMSAVKGPRGTHVAGPFAVSGERHANDIGHRG